MQWATAHRLASRLLDEARLLPTHGAGSFCSATDVGGQRTTTLAAERAVNPALLADFDAFRAVHLAALPPIPAYYQHMAPINRAGPKVYGEPPRSARLDANALDALLRASVRVVDVRDRHAFARAHVPGSVLIEESTSMLAYAGWLLPFNPPLALVTTDAAQADRVTTDLFRIAYEDVRGYLPFDAWQRAARPVAALNALNIDQARAATRDGRTLIDVRFDYEQDATPISGALRRPIDRLPEWLADPGAESPLLVCASGQRASTAASFFASAGRPAAFLIDGGADDLR
jgi:rhodanese-related sulfurtransferase